jgi:putative ABC transport system substrate-binding protein
MRRAALAALLLAAAPPAALPAAEIALLKSNESASWRPAIDALRRVAAAHTFQEFDLRGDKAEADRAVAALKGKAAAIVALGPLAAQAAREGAPELPLVVCMVSDPAKLGIQPGPNVTGVSLHPPVKNQLAAFRMVNPRGVRLGVLYNPDNVGRLVQEAQKAAPVVRMAIVERAIGSAKDVPQGLRALMGGDGIDALWLPPDPLLLGDEARRYVLQETLKAGKPVYAFSAALVQEGALVSNGAEMASTGEQAADLLLRLLGAEKGARLELAMPKAELVINKKVADRLRIEIPADALKAAAKVF